MWLYGASVLLPYIPSRPPFVMAHVFLPSINKNANIDISKESEVAFAESSSFCRSSEKFTVVGDGITVDGVVLTQSPHKKNKFANITHH